MSLSPELRKMWPMCAKCRKPVETLTVTHDQTSRHSIFIAQCHDQTEETRISFAQFLDKPNIFGGEAFRGQ